MCFVSFILTLQPQAHIPTASHPPLNSPVDSLAAVQIIQSVSAYHENPNNGEHVVANTKPLKLCKAEGVYLSSTDDML